MGRRLAFALLGLTLFVARRPSAPLPAAPIRRASWRSEFHPHGDGDRDAIAPRTSPVPVRTTCCERSVTVLTRAIRLVADVLLRRAIVGFVLRFVRDASVVKLRPNAPRVPSKAGFKATRQKNAPRRHARRRFFWPRRSALSSWRIDPLSRENAAMALRSAASRSGAIALALAALLLVLWPLRRKLGRAKRTKGRKSLMMMLAILFSTLVTAQAMTFGFGGALLAKLQ